MDRDKKTNTLPHVAARIKNLSRPIPITAHVQQKIDNSSTDASISPEKIPCSVSPLVESASQLVEKPEDDSDEVAPQQVEKQIEKRIIVERFPNIGGMFNKIGNVQPDPLPPHIEYLLKCGLDGLDFVKIPTAPKTDQLYLKNAAYKLMKLCGVNWDDLEEAIDIYNKKKDIPENLKLQGYDMEKMKHIMIAMVTVSKYYADRHNVEFLTNPEEFDSLC